MRYGSVCSGIEAATVAWSPLGWQAAWFSEIEPFPCAVLRHHYPDVPNFGDMTILPVLIRAGAMEAPDILCGGTPCQAFSVAGLRKSLDDARGNLSLTFCEIANAIDDVRADRPAIVFWENVPGVLNTKDNAFGCFLAGLAGEDAPLEPPGGKWANAGCVLGPRRTVAWRTLDAQWFGLAQRRRRVFVVASARTDFDPLSVLLEFNGVRRDIAPSREAGKGAARDARSGAAFGGGNTSGSIDVAAAVNACGGSGRMDFESETFVTHAPSVHATLVGRSSRGGGQTNSPGHNADESLVVTHALTGNGFDASEDGTGRGAPLVPVTHCDVMPTMTSGPTTEAGHNARSGHSKDAYVVPIVYDTTQITSVANRSRPEPGDPLAAGAHAPLLAFHHNAQVDQMRFDPHTSSSSLTCSQQAAVAYSTKLHNTASKQAGKFYENYTASLDRSSPPPALVTAMQVRRLTPQECERLQGFPDSYTLIPLRQVPAKGQEKARALLEAGDERFAERDGVVWVVSADGPRYRALGNSWAVPVVRWIGARIASQLSTQ